MGWEIIGGALTGGLLNMFGQGQANAANQNLSQEQMNWQKMMSDTAHQREVNDLRSAGLNPILSVNAGASSPGGAAIPMQNTMAGLGTAISSSARDVVEMDMRQEMQNQQIASMALQNDKTRVETALAADDLSRASLKNKIWTHIEKGYDSATSAIKQFFKSQEPKPWPGSPTSSRSRLRILEERGRSNAEKMMKNLERTQP